MITDCHNCGREGIWRPGEDRVHHRVGPPCPVPPPDLVVLRPRVRSVRVVKVS